MRNRLRSWFLPSVGAEIDEPLSIGFTGDIPRLPDVFKPADPGDLLNLDDAVRQLTGHWLPILNQRFAGCCTAAAWTQARALSSAAKAVIQPRAKISRISPEGLYGMARTRLVKPNNARPGCGLGDVALIARSVGVIESRRYQIIDLTIYDPMTALRWEKTGPPAILLPQVLKPVESYLCFGEAEVRTALAHKMAVVFASRWYFTRTDSSGIIQPTSIAPPLGHAMTIQGCDRVNGKIHYCIRNTMGSQVFTGGQHPRFPVRGTGLMPADQANQCIFNQGAMFAVSGKI
jgi:hypothetical protein